MSQALSPSFACCYGLARVARVWKISRASVYRSLKETPPNTSARRPGPVGACSDAELADHIRRQIDASRLHGEGYRKLWARLPPRRRSDAGIPWRRASRKCRRGGRATAFHRGTAETGAETRSSSGRTVQYRRRFPPRRALRASTTAAPLRAGRSPCRAASGPENP